MVRYLNIVKQDEKSFWRLLKPKARHRNVFIYEPLLFFLGCFTIAVKCTNIPVYKVL